MGALAQGREDRPDGSRSRRSILRGALATGVALTLSGCGAGTPRRPFPDPPVTWREPFGPRFAVMIDPGHGGDDTGTRAANGLLEKDLTLDIARRLRAELAAEAIDVSLTRDRDIRLSRDERVAAVRAAGADLLLSLHFNMLPERDIALVETYYAHAANIVDSRARRRLAGQLPLAGHEEPGDVSFTRGSERFARLLQRRVFDAVASGNGRAVDAGVKRDTLFVLTRGLTSGALVELSCLSNAAEAERLMGESYREELVEALAGAVREYRRLSNIVAPAEPDM